MTNEEKARAYDEALEDMRVIYPNLRGDAKLAVEHAFPELAESEYERMKRIIMKFVWGYTNTPHSIINGDKSTLEYAKEVEAYLEKQKPAIFYVPDDADLSHPRNKLAFMLGQYRKQGHINEEEYWQMLKYLIGKEQKPVQNPKKECPTYPLSVVGDLLAKTPQEPIRFEQEQKHADDKVFEEWIDDWWKHNKVNNPDSYDKGDEIQFDEQGFKNFCRGIRNMYQQKPEWSKKDEKQIAQIERIVESTGCSKTLQEKIHNWFKSLRPSWKPSEEQMGALSWMLENARGNIDFDPLKELYEQLKKLM